MADASETLVTEQEVALEVAEKQEDSQKTNGGEEVILQKVEDVEGESKPEDVPTNVLAAETVVVAVPEANDPVVETVPDAIKEVAEAENEKQIEIPSVVEDVLEKAVIEEAPEDKKEEGQETATPGTVEETITKEVIEDKAVVEEEVKEEKPAEAEAKDESETGSNAKAAVAEAEVTDPVKPEKKQSRNVISRMKRSFSKVKKAFAGKLPGSKTSDADAKA